MATQASLEERYQSIQQLYHEHYDLILQTQASALELFPNHSHFLSDPATIFRFLRRSKFATDTCLANLRSSMGWRTTHRISSLTFDSLDECYQSQPLFYFHPALQDAWQRPAGIINLRYVKRTPDGKLDALRRLVVLGWETGRRYMAALSKSRGEPVIQMALMVDLQGAGMGNLEVELFPFFLELLKSHFPGSVSSIYILNYSWLHSGLWALVKQFLPPAALERIVFPSTANQLVPTFFSADHLPRIYGGSVDLEDCDLCAANPIFGLMNAEAHNNLLLDLSDEEDDSFYSAPSSQQTSRTVSRRPSWMHLTSFTSETGSTPSRPLLTVAVEQARSHPSKRLILGSGATTPASRSESGFATPASGVSHASTPRRTPRSALVPHRQTFTLPAYRRFFYQFTTFLFRISRLSSLPIFSNWNGKRQVTFNLPPEAGYDALQPTSRRWPYYAYAAMMFVILRSTWLGRFVEQFRHRFVDKFRLR